MINARFMQRLRPIKRKINNMPRKSKQAPARKKTKSALYPAQTGYSDAELLQKAIQNPTCANLTPQTVQAIQSQLGNRVASQLISRAYAADSSPEAIQRTEAIIQRKSVQDAGYTQVNIAKYFKDTHLAENEADAIHVSEARGEQYGRGQSNTVVKGKATDVSASFKAADYDAAYHINGTQYGVKLTGVDYWQVDMLASTDGYTVRDIEEKTGDVWVKAYFDTAPKVTVSGVDAT